jgi:hypothetical protein
MHEGSYSPGFGGFKLFMSDNSYSNDPWNHNGIGILHAPALHARLGGRAVGWRAGQAQAGCQFLC